MDACAVFGIVEVVLDVDDDLVAPVGEDCWAWDGAVDGHYGSAEAVWCGVVLFKVEPVLAGHACVWYCLGVVGVHVMAAPLGACARCVTGTGGSCWFVWLFGSGSFGFGFCVSGL